MSWWRGGEQCEGERWLSCAGRDLAADLTRLVRQPTVPSALLTQTRKISMLVECRTLPSAWRYSDVGPIAAACPAVSLSAAVALRHAEADSLLPHRGRSEHHSTARDQAASVHATNSRRRSRIRLLSLCGSSRPPSLSPSLVRSKWRLLHSNSNTSLGRRSSRARGKMVSSEAAVALASRKRRLLTHWTLYLCALRLLRLLPAARRWCDLRHCVPLPVCAIWTQLHGDGSSAYGSAA